MLELKHDLKLAKTRDEKARMNFVSGLRSYVLNDMADGQDGGVRGVDDGDEVFDIERAQIAHGEGGPFDIIGDVHGCFDELVALLRSLSYTVDPDGTGARHPDGRRALFVGDLVDRGPATPAVLRLVMGMVGAGDALPAEAVGALAVTGPVLLDAHKALLPLGEGLR